MNKIRQNRPEVVPHLASPTTELASDVRDVLRPALSPLLVSKKDALIAFLNLDQPTVAINQALDFAVKNRLPNDIFLSPEVHSAAKACLERKLHKTNAQNEALVKFIQTFAIDQFELNSILTRTVLRLLQNAGAANVIELNKIIPFHELMRGDPELKKAAKAVVEVLLQRTDTQRDAAAIMEIFGIKLD